MAVDKLMKNRAGSAINKERLNEVLSPSSDEEKMGGVRVFEIRAAQSTFGVCYKCLTPFLTVSNSWGKRRTFRFSDKRGRKYCIHWHYHTWVCITVSLVFIWLWLSGKIWSEFFSEGSAVLQGSLFESLNFFVVEYTQKPWFWLLWKSKHWS